MKYLKILIIPVVVIAVILILILGSKSSVLTIGDQVPDFRLKDLQGNDFFSNDCRGKVVLINFWATWCTYCLEELPFLESLHGQYQTEGLQVISILKDVNNIDRAMEIKDQNLINYPVLLDKNEELFKKLVVSGLPYTALVDSQGKIRFIHLGFTKKDEKIYQNEIGELLAERKK